MNTLIFANHLDVSWVDVLMQWLYGAASSPLAHTIRSFLPNILVALGLGALIGFERWRKHKVAGLRTHMVISMSACVVTMCGVLVAESVTAAGGTADATRLAHGILAGIGFVGAGVILRRGLATQGITTAATILFACGIGMAAGFGFFALATVSTVLLLFAMVIAYRFMPHDFHDRSGSHVDVICPQEKFAEAKALLGATCRVEGLTKTAGKVEFRAHTDLSPDQLDDLLEKAVGLDDIDSIQLVRPVVD